jgi:hypothetical protein
MFLSTVEGAGVCQILQTVCEPLVLQQHVVLGGTIMLYGREGCLIYMQPDPDILPEQASRWNLCLVQHQVKLSLSVRY